MANPAQLQPAAPPAAPTLTEDMLRKRFLDFDNTEVYEDVKVHGANEHARNFVVQFGPQKAEIATDLDASEIEFYIDKARSREEDPPIRWINIWNPGKQMEAVSLLADRYGFSARLKMSIVMWDMMKDNRPKAPEPTHRLGRPSFSRSRRDLEQGANGAVQQPEQKEQNKMAEMLMSRTTEEDAATFHLMQSSLNYTSIDPDQAFICLGANWLHQRPKFTAKGHEKKEGSLVPPKHWSWFVLCNDNTVISFHEAATYDAVPEGESIHQWRKDELKYMRSNTLKVLKQLSKNASQKEKIAFTQLSNVRFSLRDDADNPAALGVEGSSNLFYYLFEDYSAAVDIVNSSKKTLESLRKVVLSDHQRQHDTKGIINKIYTLKRELSQLKQLFASYKTLIERLLAEFDLNGDAKGDGNRGDAKGRLSKKARDRFERLKDRIQSLMLDAIQEALGEQQSLQETWFNLTRERDSRATARLTRSATLLAKLSVLFLPVTFMTSYFSVEIPHLMDNYTPRTYWVSFAVIASVSFVALFFFGRVLELLTDGFEEMAERARRWLVERMCWPGSRAHREARRAEAEEERELDGWKI